MEQQVWLWGHTSIRSQVWERRTHQLTRWSHVRLAMNERRSKHQNVDFKWFDLVVYFQLNKTVTLFPSTFTCILNSSKIQQHKCKGWIKNVISEIPFCSTNILVSPHPKNLFLVTLKVKHTNSKHTFYLSCLSKYVAWAKQLNRCSLVMLEWNVTFFHHSFTYLLTISYL